MAEYISRDWLLTHTHTGMDTIQMMQTMIDAPAADVVEVRWLPVVGYEGLYEISNFGDVRCSDGTPVRQSVNHKKNTDYKCVWLKKNGVGKPYMFTALLRRHLFQIQTICLL